MVAAQQRHRIFYGWIMVAVACVVVGISHAVDQPVWSRLEGVTSLAGQEHRHFQAAGRYVGLFWFRDASSAEEVRGVIDRELSGLRIVSVSAFREEAGVSGQSAAFTDLDTPAALPPQPCPVWGP